jgi:hypothetical protein
MLAITEAATGLQCVGVGGSVLVTLHGGTGQEWGPVQSSAADVLQPVSPAATLALPSAHVTVAAFAAERAGSADLSSSRNACPPPAPGSVACHAIQAFRVTLTVR